MRRDVWKIGTYRCIGQALDRPHHSAAVLAFAGAVEKPVQIDLGDRIVERQFLAQGYVSDGMDFSRSHDAAVRGARMVDVFEWWQSIDPMVLPKPNPIWTTERVLRGHDHFEEHGALDEADEGALGDPGGRDQALAIDGAGTQFKPLHSSAPAIVAKPKRRRIRSA